VRVYFAPDSTEAIRSELLKLGQQITIKVDLLSLMVFIQEMLELGIRQLVCRLILTIVVGTFLNSVIGQVNEFIAEVS
jgi:hypothetical protein